MRIPWIFGDKLPKPSYKLAVYRPNMADETVRGVITLSLIVLSTLLLSGFVYALINLPPAVISVEGTAGMVSRHLDSQTSMEVVLVAFLTFMGAFGSYLVRRSLGKLMEEEELQFWLGFAFVVISFVVIFVLLWRFKLSMYTR